MSVNSIIRAPRNRTLTISQNEKTYLARELLSLEAPVSIKNILGKIINQDAFNALLFIPSQSVDLIVVDPPYNKTKNYNAKTFYQKDDETYIKWLDDWIKEIARIAKPNASIYICTDWQSSLPVQIVAERYFKIQNRITWEREKGRGAKSNWKNCSEDIWFCTMSNDYTFNVDAVKLKRKVIAPYRHEDGNPKDWEQHEEGNHRLTHPSNVWTDITVPFWSMPENTDHPTQKPEKLIAKLILASSNAGDIVFDPFLGSGTTAVVAKKLNRNYFGIEIDVDFACLALKRLALAEQDASIQGYSKGVFWERNSLAVQKKSAANARPLSDAPLPWQQEELKLWASR